MHSDPTLRPEDRSLVICPKCGGQTAVLLKDATQGEVRCNHCTAVIGKNLLALGITPPSQGGVSEHPTDIVENRPFGRYLLKKELGRGGMGVVWLAEDPTLGRQVALKLLSGAGAEDIARFEREARTAASLSHPNIAPVYEVGVQDGRPYLSMQYIAGRTLDQAIVERRVSARQAAEIMRDAALAVHYAHENHVIHRDLKPQNIMIQPEGGSSNRIYVLDFGLARRTGVGSSISVSGTVVGTPAFMSPEQAVGSTDVDARSDVYGLGATLYALVTGKPPYEGPSPIDVIMKVAHVEPTAPRKIHPAMHQDLETIILTAMAREKERRYATAAAMAEDLERFLDNEPILARPASMMYRLSRRVRKHPASIAAGAAAIVAIVLGAWVFSMQTGRTREHEETTKRARAALDAGRWSEARGLYQDLFLHTPTPEFQAALKQCEAEIEKEHVRREADERASHVAERLDDARGLFESPQYDPAETWSIVEAALKELDGLTEKSPDLAPVLTQRARANRMLHRIKAARRDIDRAVELDPALRTARLERIRLIFEEVATTMAGVERGSEGRAYMDENLEIAKKDQDVVRAGTGTLPPRAVKDLRLAELLRGFMASSMRAAAKKDLEREAAERRDPEFWYYLAIFRGSDSDLPGAREALKQALEMRPCYAAAILVLANWADDGQAPAEALAKYAEAIRLDPYDIRGHINRSSVRFSQKDYPGALSDLRGALLIDRDNVTGWTNLYVVGQATKNTDLTMESAEALIRIKPKSGQGYSMRADVYAVRKDFDRMLDDLAVAAEKEPGHAFVRRRYGEALLNRFRLKEGLAEFEAAVKADPDNPKGYLGRARALIALNDEAQALTDLERYLRLVPDDVVVLLDTARARFKLAKFAGGLEAVERALAKSPDNYDALSLKGDLLRAMDESQQALDAYNAAVELDENRPEARIGRAWLLQNNGYGKEAMDDLSFVLERYPKNEFARALRAREHMVHKRWEEALKDIDEVITAAGPMKKELEKLREQCVQNLKKQE